MNIGNTKIGREHRAYIIAELCNNFNGDIEVAKELITQCAAAGVDACKFQMRLQEDRISLDEHKILRLHCWRRGVTYLCTAFDKKGVEILREMNIAAIKIGSGQCHDLDLLMDAKSLGIPVIVSTGGCSSQDVDEIACVADIILHTTSIYPTPYSKVALGCIQSFSSKYHNVIGLSDHTPTTYTSIAAIALGARVIEKHVTLDKTQDGPDHSSSVLPGEMAEIVNAAHALHLARSDAKVCHAEELEKFENIV